MKFANARAADRRSAGAAGVALALQRDLDENPAHLPLAPFCHAGGWPVDPQIDGVRLLENGPLKLVALVSISFREAGLACCSDEEDLALERAVQLTLVIDKRTWSGLLRYGNELD